MFMWFSFPSAFNRLSSAVVLEVFENRPGLFGREVRPDAHVQQDGLPLFCCSFRRITLGMTTIAVDGVELGTGKRLRRLLFRFGGGRGLFRFGRLFRAGGLR